jgi:hypothetical protein
LKENRDYDPINPKGLLEQRLGKVGNVLAMNCDLLWNKAKENEMALDGNVTPDGLGASTVECHEMESLQMAKIERNQRFMESGVNMENGLIGMERDIFLKLLGFCRNGNDVNNACRVTKKFANWREYFLFDISMDKVAVRVLLQEEYTWNYLSRIVEGARIDGVTYVSRESKAFWAENLKILGTLSTWRRRAWITLLSSEIGFVLEAQTANKYDNRSLTSILSRVLQWGGSLTERDKIAAWQAATDKKFKRRAGANIRWRLLYPMILYLLCPLKGPRPENRIRTLEDIWDILREVWPDDMEMRQYEFNTKLKWSELYGERGDESRAFDIMLMMLVGMSKADIQPTQKLLLEKRVPKSFPPKSVFALLGQLGKLLQDRRDAWGIDGDDVLEGEGDVQDSCHECLNGLVEWCDEDNEGAEKTFAKMTRRDGSISEKDEQGLYSYVEELRDERGFEVEDCVKKRYNVLKGKVSANK